MGYTHYFSLKAIKGKKRETERLYQKAIVDCQRAVRAFSVSAGGVSGFAAHVEPGRYKGLRVNGSKNSGMCEDFMLPEKFIELKEFCKTNRYAYDTPVTACLCILKHYLGDAFTVASDGDSSDWINGFELAKTIVPGVKMPNSVDVRLKAVE